MRTRRNGEERSARSRTAWPAIVSSLLVFAWATATTATTPEDLCQAGRGKAAVRFAACMQFALSHNILLQYGKCVTRYANTWPRLQRKAAGSGATCDNPRFADNGDGTVTDRLTALLWEQKTDDSTIHDGDNAYTWSPGDPMFSEAAGTVFTTFLATLNTPGNCFVGQCDWRLPTRSELLTIITPPYPACGTSVTGPCIDPVFGRTPDFSGYWTATSHEVFPVDVWFVDFQHGGVGFLQKTVAGGMYARAVRGGL